ncbi:hypothetical protein QBC35DRAFT_380256 [Podospora australis]|uniref:SMODS and SLOG-associating 2TM effector domain-containing protein n=1 Tax=Podospora australis TaxID=1536484 RepID=A0AAN6WWZ8_9PEZI|nr:hypothetical protein QBC35DRAFT_380256 [Podospora australis]
MPPPLPPTVETNTTTTTSQPGNTQPSGEVTNTNTNPPQPPAESSQTGATHSRQPIPPHHTTLESPVNYRGTGPPAIMKADTDISWGIPQGLHIRPTNDESLNIFRKAVGINTTLPSSTDWRSLEEGRKGAVGMYAAAMRAQRNKKMTYRLIAIIIYASHIFQIIVGASLTALGPSAGDHTMIITSLGALNTVIAGVLALLKGNGLPDRLRHQVAEFRKLQDWIEQTESLLAVGVIGRDRKEVGLLVQSAFKKYNAAKECEESTANLPMEAFTPPGALGVPVGREMSRSPSPGHRRDNSSDGH